MSESMAEVLTEVLGEVWDDGNCTGLDGWIGPGRGAGEVDAEALHDRERVIGKAIEQLAANGYGKLEDAALLIRDLTDPDDCQFDHDGGCQAHGYLDLKPGENCPQHDAKEFVRAATEIARKAARL